MENRKSPIDEKIDRQMNQLMDEKAEAREKKSTRKKNIIAAVVMGFLSAAILLRLIMTLLS